jgi:hypothetical protein
VDELLQVRGMTRDLLYGRPDAPGLAEHVTVFGVGAVNMNTASPVVLRALGFAPAEVELVVARRPWVDPVEIPFRRGNLRTSTTIFRIEAWAGGSTPSGRVLTAVVERQAGSGQVQTVPVAWRWSEVFRAAAVTPATSPSRSGQGKGS